MPRGVRAGRVLRRRYKLRADYGGQVPASSGRSPGLSGAEGSTRGLRAAAARAAGKPVIGDIELLARIQARHDARTGGIEPARSWALAAREHGDILHEAPFAALFLGSLGLVLGALLIGLTVATYLRRGWERAVAWILVGAGLVPTVILPPAVFSTDPAVHYVGESYVTLAVGLLVLLVGLAWAAASMPNR